MTKRNGSTRAVLKRVMKHKRKAHRPPPGTAPDALVPSRESHATSVRLFSFDTSDCQDSQPTRQELLSNVATKKHIRWIDVQGLADLDLISELGKSVGLHPLVVADIVHTHQRPKVDIYDNYLVVIMRMPRLAADSVSEQITLIVGERFVLTFQEQPGDCFDPVRERLRSGLGRIRASGADYLAYALIDTLIDSYFPLLESYGLHTERIEEQVLANPAPTHIGEIHLLKRELLDLRHAIWPLRDALGALLRDDVPLIRKATKIYLRDCADHAFQLLDILEVYREIASGLVDLHLSSLSNRMNEVMKVLTVIATIFIPMTFIAGVYGMNFDRASPFNLPELGWRYGYWFALALMAVSASVIVTILYRRGWIGREK